MKIKVFPNFDIENEIGAKLIAGVDEAGRGPLCGPVVAAAVIVPAKAGIPCIINDSKKMTAIQRAESVRWIRENTIWAVGMCSPTEIDEINILQASMTAMRRAIDALATRPDFVLVDGNRLPMDVVGRAVVKGDAKSISIAAASILAKETRDEIMRNLAAEFPQYGWDKNAGYPTPAHLHAMQKYGINEHYRKSYKPVKDIINA